MLNNYQKGAECVPSALLQTFFLVFFFATATSVKSVHPVFNKPGAGAECTHSEAMLYASALPDQEIKLSQVSQR